MDNWIIFILGAIIGIGLGSYFTAMAKPQKQWSELTKNENVIDKFVCVRVPWTGAADKSLKSPNPIPSLPVASLNR